MIVIICFSHHSSFRMAMLSSTPSPVSYSTYRFSYHRAIGLFFERRYYAIKILPPNMMGVNSPYCTPRQGFILPSCTKELVYGLNR